MRKFLSVIAWAIAATALIIGGIIVFAQLGKFPSFEIATMGLHLGVGIALFGGGIGAAIGSLASFFTAKTIDK